MLALLTIVSAALPVGYSLTIRDAFARGLVVGAGLSLTVAAAAGVVIVFSGSATVSAGAWAEGWTSSELQVLRQHGYHLINHAGLRRADIDHFLVGPGGVFAFETKWSGSEWIDADNLFLERACAQVAHSAQTVAAWLDVRRGIEVKPVLVLWGRAATAVRDRPSGVGKRGLVTVVDGQSLEEWALRLPRTSLPPEAVQAIHDRMAKQVASRDAREAAGPASVGTLITRTYLTILIFGLATYAPALLGSLVDVRLGLGFSVLLALTAMAVRRRTDWKWEAMAAASGALVLPMLTAGALVWSAVA